MPADFGPIEMTGKEYGRALDQLGLSNRGFCLLILGVDDKTGRNWKSGRDPVPGAVAALLRLALSLKLTDGKLEARLRGLHFPAIEEKGR